MSPTRTSAEGLRSRATASSRPEASIPAPRAPRSCADEFEGQSSPAGHVEEADTFVEGELVVEGDVLPAVGELAQRGEVNGSSAPSLVDDGPIRGAAILGR